MHLKNLDTNLVSFIKIISKEVIDQNAKCKITEFLEENMDSVELGDNLTGHQIKYGSDDVTPTETSAQQTTCKERSRGLGKNTCKQ